jgi:YD repeat-containing protein
MAAYDGTGNQTAVLDADGSKSCRRYSTKENLLLIAVDQLPSGTDCGELFKTMAVVAPAKVTTLAWLSNLRLPTSISTPKQLVSLAYDGAGRLTTLRTVATTDETGAAGLRATPAGLPKVERFAYNEAGQLISYKGPRTDVDETTKFTYNPAGVLTAVINPLGQTTLYSNHDTAGRPGKVVTPAGLVTTLSYDKEGQISTVNTGGRITAYTYQRNGWLSSKTSPDGMVLKFSYDGAGQLTSVTDGYGSTVRYQLSTGGAVVTEQVFDTNKALFQAISRSVDDLNRLTKVSGASWVNPQPSPYVP